MWHWNMMYPYGLSLGNYQPLVAWLLPLMLWSLVWKGLVLWVTARRNQTWWFILFLVLNTAGIAEIIYLLMTDGFDKLRERQK